MLQLTVGAMDVCKRKTSRLGPRFGYAFCTALVFFSAAAVHADYVILKNGKRLDGLVRAETSQEVRIETIGGIWTLGRDRIERIEKQPTGENLMLSGILALREPDFIEGSSLLRRSLEAGGDPAQMRKQIIQTSPRFLDRLAYISKTEKKEWVAVCDDLSRRGPADGDWAYFRGDMAIAMGDVSAALGAWRGLNAAFFADHPSERERVIRWVLPRLSQAVAGQRLDESIAMLELINSVDPERARAHRVLLAMQKAWAARTRDDIAEACRIYVEEVMPLAPAIGTVCLRMTLEPHCDALCERGAFGDAIALLRTCTTPQVREITSQLLAKAYRGQIERYLADGQWEKAGSFLAEGGEFFATPELERLRQACAYGRQRAGVAADDYAGHYKLGLELQGKKMNEAAIEEFILASRSPQLKEMADKQIALVHEGEALALMEQIVSHYGEKKYLEVLDLVEEFRRKFPGSDLTPKVDGMSKLAHRAAAAEAKTTQDLAASRIEYARRLSYRGKTDEALEVVDGVLRDTPTTSPVAPDARLLKQEILKMRLAEGTRVKPLPASQPTSPTTVLLPNIDPSLLNQLNEDAFKNEIQEILKQLQL
jgi:hypothetical protein